MRVRLSAPSLVLALVLAAHPSGAREPIDARPTDAPVAWNTAGVLRATDPLGAGNVSVQLWTLYRSVPAASDAATRSMVLGDLAASLGLSRTVTLGIAVPVLVRGYGIEGVPLSALGDARFALAHTLVAPGVVGPGVAWSFGFRAPTGDRLSGIAYAAPAVSAAIHGEYRLGIAEALAHVGAAHVLDGSSSTVGAVPAAPRTLIEAGFGITMRMRDILRVGPSHPRIELASTVRHSVEGSGAFDAVFMHLSERFLLDDDGDVSLLAGLGMSVAGPSEAFGTVGLRYSPRMHDTDGDGVPDRLDQCPELEEDRDGFEDSDGCPDIDNDGDDVSDEDDQCPNVAGDAEHKGCPAPPEEAPEAIKTPPEPTREAPND